MFLTQRELAAVTAFRHELHRRPEPSGEEVETARAVAAALEVTSRTESSRISADTAWLRCTTALKSGRR
ncbi:hypothetical protein I6F07_26870 [Ensifer sp. IC4062]|nr:hypothetical protein [Ensifer sp. IC4062]